MDYSLLGKIDDFGEVARSQELGRVGLVYCAELLGYAGRVNEILKDKVSTCMLVCPARCSGGLPQGDVSEDMPCRPSEQAENIDKAGCDFVMIIGHCPAFQAVLPERVRAVSAVLFPGKVETAASKTGLGA